jgi:hypothetical protein
MARRVAPGWHPAPGWDDGLDPLLKAPMTTGAVPWAGVNRHCIATPEGGASAKRKSRRCTATAPLGDAVEGQVETSKRGPD